MEEKKNSLLSIFLTPDAKERLRRIEIVSPERASRVEAILLQQMQRGQLSPQSVSDDMLKGLLEQLTDVHTRGLVVGGIDVADEATGSGRVIISRRGADAFMGSAIQLIFRLNLTTRSFHSKFLLKLVIH